MSIYRIIKLDETSAWTYDFGKEVKVFGCYVFDPYSHTYCCELFPSYELRFVHTDVTRELTEKELDMINEAENEPVTYMHVNSVDRFPYAEVEADSIDEAIEELNANWRDVPEKGHYDVYGKLIA